MNTEENLTIEEIESVIGEEPIFYLKFTSKESFANDVVEGKLYANTPEWFRNKELETGEHGQGDKNELQYAMPLFSIRFINPETGNCDFELPHANGRIAFKDDDKLPLVCFVGIPLHEMRIISQTPETMEIALPFSESEYSEMGKRFGEYCVIVEAKALIEGLQQYCNDNSCQYILKKVTYCVSNFKEKAEAFANGSTDRFFFKDEDFAYQREYRLVLSREIPDDHFIKISSLKGKATVVKSEQLSNLCLCIKAPLKSN